MSLCVGVLGRHLDIPFLTQKTKKKTKKACLCLDWGWAMSTHLHHHLRYCCRSWSSSFSELVNAMVCCKPCSPSSRVTISCYAWKTHASLICSENNYYRSHWTPYLKNSLKVTYCQIVCAIWMKRMKSQISLSLVAKNCGVWKGYAYSFYQRMNQCLSLIHI